jgi:hypothetical protein
MDEDEDEFIHWRKPYLLFSTTCDEMLSWMIEIWMKNHLVNDGKRNIVIPPKNHNESQIQLGKQLVLVTLYRGLQ